MIPAKLMMTIKDKEKKVEKENGKTIKDIRQ